MLPAVDTEQLKLDKQVSIAGFYLPKKKEENKEETLEQSVEKLDLNCAETQSEAQNETKVETSLNTDSNNSENENLNESKNGEGEEEEEEVDENNNEEENEEDDDDEGWITPSNLEKAKKMSRVESEQQEINNMELKVACMTSDFAMQVCLLLLIAFNCY